LTATMSLFLSTGSIDKSTAKTNEDNVARGTSIMIEVFHRFHINYEMSRVHKLGYYQEAMEDAGGVHYLAESIVDIYVPHNISQEEHASIKPLKARKKTFEDVNSEDLLFGNASDMARCSIWRPNSFLNEKNRNNYIFKYVDDTVFKRLKVSKIKFYPATSKGVVSGTILVDKKSFAILHIDYTPDTSGSKLWNKVTWTEEFYYSEGRYELAKVKFEGLCSKNTYEYSATLIMQHLRILTEIPDHDDFIDKEGSLFDHAGEDFTENFWNGYQALKVDVDSEYDDVVHLASK
ncbi:MAG: hypothetical protein AAF391_07885, partial [Bacteroidota bacterium]